ncbi:MAG: carbamoyltransferase HypF [Bacteroidota bacterium]
MQTWHIHIDGQVQGIGFRPHVYNLAERYGFKGWVNNGLNGVHIEFNAEENEAKAFEDEIAQYPPPLSQITSIKRYKVQPTFFDNFQIINSKEEGKPNLLLTPDLATCDDCKKELLDVKNRRYGYAFITCTKCGPRYSIVRKLPYDRERTEMRDFHVCSTCNDEYNDPSDRRYYSQTNSCKDCGVEMSLYHSSGNKLALGQDEIIDQVVDFWKDGKIVAIKGIGGYLLTCDAKQSTAVVELRKRKHRPSKPFAVMLPNSSVLQKSSENLEAIHLLDNHISPIVLIDSNQIPPFDDQVAPGLEKVGIMIPYTPLLKLLLSKFDNPIVATSGNVSNSPIVYEDQKALTELTQIADYILTNDRKIVLPQDDSVIQFSPFQKQKIILRRSRGLAPTYINPTLNLLSKSILATGAFMKSTFSLTHSGNTYVSQYLGDLGHFETLQSFVHSCQHLLNVLNAEPELVICDKNPEYSSSQYAERISKEKNIPLEKVQHHEAHFGAILGEHNLIDFSHPVLGIIWDGTGLGNDGQIWGGEFFTYKEYEFLRCAHFEYFNFIVGDKMPKEPRISALSACWNVSGAATILREKFTKTEWQIYNTLLEREAPLHTSSVGRIFDAVASLLGIMDKQTFEGEAAMRLEAAATNYFKNKGLHFSTSYFDEGVDFNKIPTRSLMCEIINDLNDGKSNEFIAAKFHFSLVRLIKLVADNLNMKHLAFSGGVFQNGMLVDLILFHLKRNFTLYFHKELSPNDENISFGQVICHHINKQKELIVTTKIEDYVFSDSR